MKPKPLLALNHFTVPCSLLTALLVSVSRGAAEHYTLSYLMPQVPSPSSELRPSSSLVLRARKAGAQSKKKAASLTSRPLYNPKAIQEQQTQKQNSTPGRFLQMVFST